MKQIYKLITLLLLCFYTSVAQESLKKHTVSSGETLLSISKKYNVTPYDLQNANPGAIDGIKINDIIIIPESKINTPHIESVADSIKGSVVSSSISHTVKEGDTKFSLSKRFGLTINQLESQNPQIVSGLHIGQVLEIFPSLTQKNTKLSPTSGKINEGKTHRVRKGETLISISSASGLTVDELVNANSKTISGSLKEGQILWIPSNNADASSINEDYIVKYGDTKFSLSRRFNTSVREMERQNPHITKMLIVGQSIKMTSDKTHRTSTHVSQTESSKTQTSLPKDDVQVEEEIVVVSKVPSEAPAEKVKKDVIIEVPSKKIIVTKSPTKDISPEEINRKEKEEALVLNDTHPEEAMEESMSSNAADSKYGAYKIQPNETVYGLAKKAGMPIADFLILNPQLKESVKIGTFIKMPKDRTIPSAISNTDDSLVLPKITSGFADLKSSANTSQSKRLLFLLPFSDKDYQNYAMSEDNYKSVSDDFKRIHLEFYKGANIAIDSLRKMNLKVDINVVEAQSSNQTSKTKSLIQERNITDYDAIILPFYKTLEEDIAAFTANSKIPIITASTIANKNITNNVYHALPSINQQRLKVLNYMVAKQAHIIVLSDVNRIESKTFIANHVPSADFVNIKKNGSFSESELKSKFKKGRLNYVIVDSERNSVFLNTTNALLSELSNYKLQLAVLETSLIPGDSDVSQKRYQILKMIFPSLIPAKSTASSKQFLSDYQKKHNLLPSANIMLGFDITYDSLLRLIQQQSFENSAINYITEYTQLKFDYEKNTLGGYSNEGIYILQYDSDANIRDAN